MAAQDRVAGTADAALVGHVDGNGGEPFGANLIEQAGSPSADDDGAAGRGKRRASSRPIPEAAPAMKTVRLVMSMP